MTAPRIGLIGARRVRQGLGPFVAGFLVEAGARVPCFLGTSRETCDAAAGVLAAEQGIVATGYTDLAAMVQAEALDGLAILSPHDTHLHYLEAALEAGLHVLCEKPLLWGAPDLAVTAHRLVAEFERRELVLWENCQWPYTLPAYEALFPDELERIARFEMRLSPPDLDRDLLADSMSHPLSLLQAMLPGGDARLVRPSCSVGAASARERKIHFDYRTKDRAVAVHVHLVPGDAHPRVAAYGMNGRWVQRLIRMRDYAIFFTDGLRVVDVPDPLRELVRDFVREITRVPDGNDFRSRRDIVQRMEMLHFLRTALEDRLA